MLHETEPKMQPQQKIKCNGQRITSPHSPTPSRRRVISKAIALEVARLGAEIQGEEHIRDNLGPLGIQPAGPGVVPVAENSGM